jgi:diguanylate cyclase (GGDEF)-like protein/PAS domain S-box-containing protein
MLPRLLGFAALAAHPRARHLLVACGVTVGLALLGATASLLAASRRVAIADAGTRLQSLSLVLAEETGREFHAVEQVVQGEIEYLQERGIDSPEKFDRALASLPVHQELRSRIAALPQPDALQLISRRGETVNSSGSWPAAAVDAHDQDFFQAFAGEHPPAAFIGAPTLGQPNGRWTFVYARAMTAPDGQLVGIVCASLSLASFEQFFARISMQDGSTVALFRTDGVLLARYPHLDPGFRRNFGGTPEFLRLLDAADHGILRRSGMFYGDDRLVAPHTVPGYPLIIAATNSVPVALAAWRLQARDLLGATALIELVIAGIVVLGVRKLRGQEWLIARSAAAMQAESELALSRQREAGERNALLLSQRFNAALSNMTQGLMMVDGTGQVLVVNRRYCELFGVPSDATGIGMTYGEIVAQALASGSITQVDMETMRGWRESAIADRAGADFTWELASGRTLMVTHQPMQDGWLTTYEDITERRRAAVKLAYMAQYDALTDLPNRTLFRERLNEAMAHTRRGQTLALLCLDLDQFKAVNDTLGHPVGDALLQVVAQRLTERVRETDTVARLGGDEFAIVQGPIDRPTEAADLAERLIAMFDEPFEVNGHQIVIGTSIGIAFAPQDGLDADQLLKNADLAMYRAKSDGRGVYRLFQTAMDAEMQARRLLEIDLRQALRAGQFELYYQPLIDLHAQSVAGFEALLRWHHPERGMIPPNRFIPLAEEIGAIVPIGEWVLRQACAAAAAWRDDLRVSVNLSPVQFNSRDLIATVTAALRDAGLAPHRLELEITETVMLADTVATLATLHELRNIGVRIAMDDFGTGYSSLSYLRRFPFDRIKIDQSFVRELGKQRDCGAIIRAVIALSHDLGMATTAEGVETREQLRTLAIAGCSAIQGYLFSRPVPLRDIPALLRTMPLVAELLSQDTLAA